MQRNLNTKNKKITNKENKQLVEKLKSLIKQFRSNKDTELKPVTLDAEQMYYIQIGFAAGLSQAAVITADELDAEVQRLGIEDPHYYKDEEQWWKTNIID